MTLLETAEAHKGEQLDVWLKALSPEEAKELWVQTVEAALDVLDQLAGAFGYPVEEVSDGD